MTKFFFIDQLDTASVAVRCVRVAELEIECSDEADGWKQAELWQKEHKIAGSLGSHFPQLEQRPSSLQVGSQR